MIARKPIFVLRTHMICVQTSSTADNFKTVSDLDSFYGIKAHKGISQTGIQSTVDRLSESRRNA